MDVIPNEIICVIFEYISPISRKRLARVCKIWWFIVQGFLKIDSVIKDLFLISSIEVGQKISINPPRVENNSLICNLYRYISGDNFDGTLAYIRDVSYRAISIYKLEPSDELLTNIKDALSGMSNLIKTYKNRQYAEVAINNLITYVRRDISL
jgi:hypothetical protein